jgi:hypothetical protein
VALQEVATLLTNMGYHLRPVLCTSYIHIVFSHNLFFIYVEWDHFSKRLFDSEVGNFVRIFIKINSGIAGSGNAFNTDDNLLR